MAIRIEPASMNAPDGTPPHSVKPAPQRSARPPGALDLGSLLGGRVKAKDLNLLYSQLSLMSEIGTSMTDALRAIVQQTKNPRLRGVIAQMCQDIEEGRQLSDAMYRHPSVFNKLSVSMVRAGESGGFLNKIIDRIVEMEEARQNMITQVRSALTYPAVLILMGVGVMVFVLVGVLPKFMALFVGKESVLPLTTRVMMGLSISLQNAWWLWLISAIGGAIGLFIFFKLPIGRAFTDRLLVSLPMVSNVANKIYTSQLMRTLGHLMGSRVPLLEALDVTRATFSNRYYNDFISRIASSVEQGGRFAQPFADNPHILPSVKQMVTTGEEVGDLPRVMLRLADFYDGEIKRDLKLLASLIEPLALVMMGAMVGLIVSSVVLPMFKLASAVS